MVRGYCSCLWLKSRRQQILCEANSNHLVFLAGNKMQTHIFKKKMQTQLPRIRVFVMLMYVVNCVFVSLCT